jgi:restriction endonuclease Mrr|tara:strand:- start:1663 stop:2067 length:405 start_codon:yes stop_codon:yes gene_type:complete
MKYTKKQLQKALIRELIRRELYNVVNEGAGGAPEEETPEEEPTEEPTEEPAEEPAEEPTEEPTEDPEAGEEDEPGLDEELQELTDLYIKKLKDATAEVDQTDIVAIVVDMLESFGYGNQDKLTILQRVKEDSLR